MKFVLIAFFITSYASISAQDTTFINSKGITVKSLKESETYTVTLKNEADTSRSFYRTYYKSGQIKSESQVINASNLMDGEVKEWYPNGQLKYDYFMKNDKFNDTITTYHQNGVIKRKDFYADGVYKTGHSFGINGKEVAHTDFYHVAEYPGGSAGLIKFLGKETKYPKSARKNVIEGTVYIQFRIMKDGRVSDAAVFKGVSSELDEEALRVVNNMPSWSPAIVDGELQISYFKLPISFKLVP